MIALCEHTGQAERGKCEDIIAAHLEERKHVRFLDKLQDPVGKPYEQTGPHTVPVRDKYDEQHTAQRNAAAPGHVKDLYVGRNVGQRNGRPAENKLLRAHFLFRGPPARQMPRRKEKDESRRGCHRIAGCRQPAFRIYKHFKHNKKTLLFSD